MAVVNENIVVIQKQVDVASRIQQSDQDQKMLDWLTPIEFGPQHSDSFRRQQQGTGKWFLDSVKYQTWLGKDKQQTLFCPGIPGAGKTILTSILIENLKKRFGDDPRCGIAYIYCDFRRQDEQGVDQLVASLFKQLLRRQAYLPQLVRSLYDKHQREKTRPSLKELTEALQSVASTYERIFIAIDALDECQANDNCRSQFLKAIFELQDRTKRVNIFATSRWNPDIEEKFKGHPWQEIRATREDVSTYLEGKLNDFPVCVKEDREIQSEIKEYVIESTDGM